jgi:hypothetical protein
MNSTSVYDLLDTKEFKELSKLLEIIFRKSLEFTTIKNISMEDVGKFILSFQKLKFLLRVLMAGKVIRLKKEKKPCITTKIGVHS